MRVEETAEREAEADAHQIKEDDIETGNPVVIFRPASGKRCNPDPYIQADEQHPSCHQTFRSAEGFVYLCIWCFEEKKDDSQHQVDHTGYGYQFNEVLF